MAKRRGSAWVKQLAHQIRKFGQRKAPWYCVWNDPTGKRRMKSCKAGPAGKKAAEALRDQLNSQMILGTWKPEDDEPAATWETFVERYIRDALADCRTSTVVEVRTSLKHFGRILKLKGRPVAGITQRAVAEFIGKRRLEGGRKRLSEPAEGETPIRAPISVATLNKELRHIKAALRTAFKWKYLPELPEVEFAREDQRLPRYMTPDHFHVIYDACNVAALPEGLHYSAGDWWRGLLTLLYMTGWRIGEALALEWADVDMVTGVALTRAESNKGRKDSLIALHPVCLEHLQPLKGFAELVFPWKHSRRRLQDTLDAIQAEAGIRIPCNIRTPHVCSEACTRYSFHDLRRAFATNNVSRLPAEILQRLMRHSSYQTTQRYIKLAKELQPTLSDVFVPGHLQIPKEDKPGENAVGS